jgi:cation:H+ antiporter
VAIFVVKAALGLVAFAIKPWLGLLFFAAYAAYFWREIRADGTPCDHADLAPLLLQRRRSTPATWAVVTQTLLTLAVIFAASQLFVHELDAIGPMLGLPAAVTALLLSPVATELPEIMNAVIWVRQGKTALALANVSGAMMIQATVPSGLGLLFTPWHFDTALLISGAATVAAIGYLLILLRTGRFRARDPCRSWRCSTWPSPSRPSSPFSPERGAAAAGRANRGGADPRTGPMFMRVFLEPVDSTTIRMLIRPC